MLLLGAIRKERACVYGALSVAHTLQMQEITITVSAVIWGGGVFAAGQCFFGLLLLMFSLSLSLFLFFLVHVVVPS